MEKQTIEEIVGRLSDFDVLDILREVLELEGILYHKAKAEGHGITYDESSTYFLYFGDLIEEMGAEKVLIYLRDLGDLKRRELLKKVLGFNVLMASLQIEEPGKEIFCASLNLDEVFGGGGGLIPLNALYED
jgi:hypothetical protein